MCQRDNPATPSTSTRPPGVPGSERQVTNAFLAGSTSFLKIHRLFHRKCQMPVYIPKALPRNPCLATPANHEPGYRGPYTVRTWPLRRKTCSQRSASQQSAPLSLDWSLTVTRTNTLCPVADVCGATLWSQHVTLRVCMQCLRTRVE